MKKTLSILLLLMFHIIAEKRPSVNVTVNNNNKNDNLVVNSFNYKQLSAMILNICAKALKKEADKFSEDSTLINTKNITILSGTIAVTTYIYNYIKLQNFHKKLSELHKWSQWKSNLSLESLLESPKEDLKNNLLNDAKKFYKSMFLDKQKLLKHDIKKEEDYLKEYLGLITKLEQYHISFLFPIKQQYINLAKEKINRLAFITGLLSN